MARLASGRVQWWPLLVAATFFPVLTVAGPQILIPIPPSPPVAGAFGSQWSTELWVHNDGTTPATLTLLPALAGQQFVVVGDQSLQIPALDSTVRGRAAILEISDDAHVGVQVQVRETSRGGTPGVAIPVVAFDSLSGAPKHLLDVPLQPEFRTTVRIYVRFSSGTAAGFTVRLFDMDNESQALEEYRAVVNAPLPLPPTFIDADVGVASIGLPSNQRRIPHARVDILADDPAQSRFWAFASVTNNSTQDVLIVAP